MDEDALISRIIPLQTSAVVQESIDGIKTACGAPHTGEIFYLSFNRLFDVTAIRKAGYRVAALDERGIVRDILKEKTIEQIAAADMGRLAASGERVAVDWILERKLFLLKEHFKTENELKLFRLAVGNLAEMVEMRQLGLKICGVDAVDNPVISLECPYLDKAEANAQAARTQFFKSMGMAPRGPV